MNHFHSSQNDIKMMGNDVLNLHNKVETFVKESKLERDGLLNRVKEYENLMNDIKEEISEHQDTFMITIESKLEEFDRKLMNTDKDNRINASNIAALEQGFQYDKTINILRSDIAQDINRLEARLNNIDHSEILNSNLLKDVESKVSVLEKSGHSNWHDLYEKINNAKKDIAGIQSQQNTVTVQNTKQLSQTLTSVDSKSTESRLARLETIAVRHGKVLDDLTYNKTIGSDQVNTTVIKERRIPIIAEELREDYGGQIKSNLESRIQTLENYWQNNDSKFRDHVIVEIDSIKKAVSEDIINLNKRITNLEACAQDQIIDRREGTRTPDSRKSRSLKRSNLNIPNNGTLNDSEDFERADGNDPNIARSNKIQNASSSIVVMNSKKNLDSSIPRVSPTRSQNINAREDSLIHNICSGECACGYHSNQNLQKNRTGYEDSPIIKNYERSLDQNISNTSVQRVGRGRETNLQPLKGRSKIAYSFDREFPK